jgi:hypothetical protein
MLEAQQQHATRGDAATRACRTSIPPPNPIRFTRAICGDLAQPYDFEYNGVHYRVDYEPGESTSGLFGGNSNWRGPVWMPGNYLLIENLRRFYQFYGDALKIECPTGSGVMLTLDQIADELCRRLIKLFHRGPDNRRPVFGPYEKFQTDPHFRDYILFHEYFHGDNGRGCGASHQTGWSGLVANLIAHIAERPTPPAAPASGQGRHRATPESGKAMPTNLMEA